MRNFERKTLAVIGAGPKGIAVAVKAKVLEEFGIPADRVILIERNGVAAHWSGDFGYTNGEMKLGTSPEKDIVFPLEIDVGDRNLNERIQQRLLQFTWTSFLVQTQGLSDWVDRGRPAPSHQLWAVYLRWVSEQLAPQVKILNAEVMHIDLVPDSQSWDLDLRDSVTGELSSLAVDRLMLTGPGKTRLDFMGADPQGLPLGTYDLESFWAAMKTRTFSTQGKLAIIGAGENAASALLAISLYAPDLKVDIVSPKGFISTRAESYYENQVYSQPERNGWADLEISDRMNFIERTDLGVFSTHAMSILNEQIRHQIIPGRVLALEQSEREQNHQSGKLILILKYHRQIFSRDYDQVILATGFDQVANLRTLFTPNAIAALEQAVGSELTQEKIASLIQEDLSVSGMPAKLHLPMLAGLMQGPGFANLSCLGRLSDRVVTGPARKASLGLQKVSEKVSEKENDGGALSRLRL